MSRSRYRAYVDDFVPDTLRSRLQGTSCPEIPSSLPTFLPKNQLSGIYPVESQLPTSSPPRNSINLLLESSARTTISKWSMEPQTVRIQWSYSKVSGPHVDKLLVKSKEMPAMRTDIFSNQSNIWLSPASDRVLNTTFNREPIELIDTMSLVQYCSFCYNTVFIYIYDYYYT